MDDKERKAEYLAKEAELKNKLAALAGDLKLHIKEAGVAIGAADRAMKTKTEKLAQLRVTEARIEAANSDRRACWKQYTGSPPHHVYKKDDEACITPSTLMDK